MGDSTKLYTTALMALLFNIVMFGIFTFVSTIDTNVQECNEEIGFTTANLSVSNPCEPEGLPLWYYAIWALINGALLYAFIPFI